MAAAVAQGFRPTDEQIRLSQIAQHGFSEHQIKERIAQVRDCIAAPEERILDVLHVCNYDVPRTVQCFLDGEVGKVDVEWEQTASRKKGGKRKSRGDTPTADAREGAAPASRASPPSSSRAAATVSVPPRAGRDEKPAGENGVERMERRRHAIATKEARPPRRERESRRNGSDAAAKPEGVSEGSGRKAHAAPATEQQSSSLAPAAGVLNEAGDVKAQRSRDAKAASTAPAAARGPAPKKAVADTKENATAAVGEEEEGKPARRRRSTRGGRKHRERRERVAEKQRQREAAAAGGEGANVEVRDEEEENDEEEDSGSDAGETQEPVAESAAEVTATTTTATSAKVTESTEVTESSTVKSTVTTVSMKRVTKVIAERGSERVVLPGSAEAEVAAVTIAFGAMEVVESEKTQEIATVATNAATESNAATITRPAATASTPSLPAAEAPEPAKPWQTMEETTRTEIEMVSSYAMASETETPVQPFQPMAFHPWEMMPPAHMMTPQAPMGYVDGMDPAMAGAYAFYSTPHPQIPMPPPAMPMWPYSGYEQEAMPPRSMFYDPQPPVASAPQPQPQPVLERRPESATHHHRAAAAAAAAAVGHHAQPQPQQPVPAPAPVPAAAPSPAMHGHAHQHQAAMGAMHMPQQQHAPAPAHVQAPQQPYHAPPVHASPAPQHMVHHSPAPQQQPQQQQHTQTQQHSKAGLANAGPGNASMSQAQAPAARGPHGGKSGDYHHKYSQQQPAQPHSPQQQAYASYTPYAPYPHAHAYPHYPQPMFPQYPFASRQQQSPAPTQGPYMAASQPVPAAADHDDHFGPSQNVTSSWGAPKQYHQRTERRSVSSRYNHGNAHKGGKFDNRHEAQHQHQHQHQHHHQNQHVQMQGEYMRQGSNEVPVMTYAPYMHTGY